MSSSRELDRPGAGPVLGSSITGGPYPRRTDILFRVNADLLPESAFDRTPLDAIGQEA